MPEISNRPKGGRPPGLELRGLRTAVNTALLQLGQRDYQQARLTLMCHKRTGKYQVVPSRIRRETYNAIEVALERLEQGQYLSAEYALLCGEHEVRRKKRGPYRKRGGCNGEKDNSND